MRRPDDTDLKYDPIGIFRILAAHEVHFVVIGGVAGNAHGSTSFTLDTDICYERTPENFAKLAAALRELRVTLRGADPGLPFRVDASTIRNGLNFTFNTAEHGPFDCLGDAGGYTYPVLLPNALQADIGGTKVLIASLDDLIRMKRVAGRLKDFAEIENLSKLRDVREERGLFGLAEPSPAEARAAARARARRFASVRQRSSRRARA